MTRRPRAVSPPGSPAPRRGGPCHVGARRAFGGGLALAESPRWLGSLLVARRCWRRPARGAAARPPRLAAAAAALVLAGAAAGDLRLAAIDAPPSASATASTSPCGRICSTLRGRAPSARRPRCEVVAGPLRGARLLARAARWAPLPRSLAIGDELALSGRLPRAAAGSAARAAGALARPAVRLRRIPAPARRRRRAAARPRAGHRPQARRARRRCSIACASAPSEPWSPGMPAGRGGPAARHGARRGRADRRGDPRRLARRRPGSPARGQRPERDAARRAGAAAAVLARAGLRTRLRRRSRR